MTGLTLVFLVATAALTALVNGHPISKTTLLGSDLKTDAKLELFLPSILASVAEYEASKQSQLEHGDTSRLDESVCYEDLGCFSRTGNFSTFGARLPQSPELLNTGFLLYTAGGQVVPEFLNYNDPESVFNSKFQAGRQTVFVIHGFTESGRSGWIRDFQTAVFRKYPAANFIAVDWATGASQDYWQSAANTQLIGAQIARLLAVISSQTGTSPSQVHLIGFSLGAHVAGLTSQKLVEFGLMRVGRITGLDPAGPVFENAHPMARLGAEDADYVQAIHSNAGTVFGVAFGIVRRVGHRDFYPNGGQYQPGCPAGILGSIGGALGDLLNQNMNEVANTVACNHFRAMAYVLEATDATSRCRTTSLPCESYDQFINGECLSGTPVDLDIFTEDAQTNEDPLYFLTNSDSGFCTNPLKVTVSLVANASPSRKGSLSLTFRQAGQNDVEQTILEATMFTPGQTYQQIISSRHHLEELAEVTVEYQRKCLLLGCRGNTHIDVKMLQIREVEGFSRNSCSLVNLPYSQPVNLPLSPQVCPH